MKLTSEERAAIKRYSVGEQVTMPRSNCPANRGVLCTIIKVIKYRACLRVHIEEGLNKGQHYDADVLRCEPKGGAE